MFRRIPQVALPGEEIARMHCGSCHLFPTPDLLNKKTWAEQVLPDMGRRLGIRQVGYDPFEGLPDSEANIIRQLGIYPDTPLISEKQWDSIVNYYVNRAPEIMQKSHKMAIVSESDAPFRPHFIEIDGKEIPQVTILYYDSLYHELYIGDNKILYALNTKGEFSGRWALPSPAVDLQVFPDRHKNLLTIGSVKPSDLRKGAFLMSRSPSVDSFELIIDSLPRPVQFSIADLDQNGREDLIICGYGHHRGSLAWYEDFSTLRILNDLPGARKAIVQDLNRDSLPDIVVLMAQAWESVDVYYNQGNGEFTKETVLEFPPVYGMSYIQLADFNSDGHADILLANGDNWDYSKIEKSYHGIRIYTNDGNNQFQEAMFYPMEGCSKAIALDFDQDGDLDIAAIAFFNDSANPEKSFNYLENTGDGLFIGHFLPEAASGKWLVMEAGDFDQDGYTDLFLGSYFHNLNEWTQLASKGTTLFPEVLYLQNSTMLIEQSVFD